ncbi:MAG: hypothetical protein ACOX19_05965 [Fermentimonas sp.]|jgi:hypothetical protein
MKTEQNNQHKAAVEPYVAPAIEVVEVELQQNILGGSGDLPDIPGEGA